MDIKTILGLSSAIVGAGIVVGQDPSFEYPGIQPTLTSSQESAPQSNQQNRVSVRFKQASAEEVLDWLSNQGVSFVTAGIPKEAKIDLNASNLPISEVIDAVGEALGGSFVKRGSTYVYQRGARNFYPGKLEMKELESLKVFEGNALKEIPSIEMYRLDPQDPKSKAKMEELHKKMQQQFGPDSEFMKKLHKELADSEKVRAKFAPDSEMMKKLHKELSENKAHFEFHGSPQDAKRWEAFGKDMEKRFGPGSAFDKEMRAHGKEMEKRFGHGSPFEKEMKVWDEKYGKEMELKFGKDSDFAKKMKAFKLENGKMRELSAKEREQMMKELEVKMKDLRTIPMPKMDGKAFVMPKMPNMPTMPKMPDMPHLMEFRGGDIAEVAKSLTSAQREKNKSQGFLYWRDLTKDQQAKLGMRSWSGNWTITYNKDGESFTIKSDK